MFRYIALALVSTFALLALAGAGMEESPGGAVGHSYAQGYGQGDVSAAADMQIALKPGTTLIAATEIPLHDAPRPDASVTARLLPGVPVVLVKPAPDGFAYVQVSGGYSGYVPAAALAGSAMASSAH